MSRTVLVFGALAVLPAAHAVAGQPQNQIPRFYLGSSMTDDTPSNPVAFANPGDTVTFHLFAQIPPGNDINNISLSLATNNPPVATPTSTTFVNPMINTPAGTFPRWTGVSTPPGSGFANATGNNPGLDGNRQGDDPTYGDEMNSLYLGSYSLMVNPVTGGVKKIVIGGSATGTIPSGMIQYGAYDAPVSVGIPTGADADAMIVVSGGPPLPGDYNGNGIVDAADYVVWRKNVGQSNTLPGDVSPGSVDASDYNVWRSNFGATAGGSPDSSSQQIGAAGNGGPHIQILDQGLTPAGKHAYLVQVASSGPLSELAIELGIDGGIVDVRALDARVNDATTAAFNDGANGYSDNEDTFYNDADWDRINRGLNPFTNTITSGFEADYADGELFLALGSGDINGTVVDLIQVVLEPGAESTFAGTIFQDGQSVSVRGFVQIPEPLAAPLALLAVPLLRRRSR